MPVEIAPPPIVPPGPVSRYSYGAFFEALLTSPGTWCSLPLDEISGGHPHKKQVMILSSARSRRIKIQTTLQGGRLYARTVEPAATVNADAATPEVLS